MISDHTVKTLDIDRISLGNDAPQAVLYLDIESTSSVPLLSYLERHASQYPSFRFIIRYKPSAHHTRVALSGYGVELALKRTDYLVVDDRASPSSEQIPFSAPSGQSDTGPFSKQLGSDPWAELSTPLRPTELAGELFRRHWLIQM